MQLVQLLWVKELVCILKFKISGDHLIERSETLADHILLGNHQHLQKGTSKQAKYRKRIMEEGRKRSKN